MYKNNVDYDKINCIFLLAIYRLIIFNIFPRLIHVLPLIFSHLYVNKLQVYSTMIAFVCAMFAVINCQYNYRRRSIYDIPTLLQAVKGK